MNCNIVMDKNKFVLSTQTVKWPAEVCQTLGLESRITVLVLEVGKEMWEQKELVQI